MEHRRLHMKDRELTKRGALGLTVVGIASALTVWLILFGLKADIFLDSTSDVGGKYGHYTEMVLLGVAYFFMYAGGGIIALRLFGYKDKIAPTVYILGCVCYLITCAIPFLPKVYPVWAQVHDVMARVTVGLLLFSTLWFIILLFKQNLWLAIVSLTCFVGAVAAAITLIVIHGTCIIAEMIIQSFLSWFIVTAIVFKLMKK